MIVISTFNWQIATINNHKKEVERMKELLESTKGTVVGDILGIIQSGSFQDIDKDIKEGEEVITDLNLFEKGAVSFINKHRGEGRKIAEILDRMAADKKTETSEFKEKLAALKEMERVATAASELMWTSVKSRISSDSIKSTGIRSGFKVVKIKCSCIACQIRKEGTLGGIGIMVVGEM